jgi:hypothetical protein
MPRPWLLLLAVVLVAVLAIGFSQAGSEQKAEAGSPRH